MNNPYTELYEHIISFEQSTPVNDDNWDSFIANIKKQVLLKQIEYSKGK